VGVDRCFVVGFCVWGDKCDVLGYCVCGYICGFCSELCVGRQVW